MDAAALQELVLNLLEEVAALREEVTALRTPVSGLLSLEEAARELKKRPATLRAWKRSGKLKSVDVGGKYPKFRRADIEQFKERGLPALTSKPRALRAPRPRPMPAELEPLEVMQIKTYNDPRYAPKALREKIRTMDPMLFPESVREALRLVPLVDNARAAGS